MRASREGRDIQLTECCPPKKQLCSLNILLECAISDEERVWELNELCWRSSHLFCELRDIQQACMMRCSHYSWERHCMEKWIEPVLTPPLGLARLDIVCWLTQRPPETGKHSGTACSRLWPLSLDADPRITLYSRASAFLLAIWETIAVCLMSVGGESWVHMSEAQRIALGRPQTGGVGML